jgi:hypothetical protein
MDIMIRGFSDVNTPTVNHTAGTMIFDQTQMNVGLHILQQVKKPGARFLRKEGRNQLATPKSQLSSTRNKFTER